MKKAFNSMQFDPTGEEDTGKFKYVIFFDNDACIESTMSDIGVGSPKRDFDLPCRLNLTCRLRIKSSDILELQQVIKEQGYVEIPDISTNKKYSRSDGYQSKWDAAIFQRATDTPASKRAVRKAVLTYTTIKECGGCKKTTISTGEQLRKCARCLVMRYCSRQCQTDDWSSHKLTCKKQLDTRTKKQLRVASLFPAQGRCQEAVARAIKCKQMRDTTGESNAYGDIGHAHTDLGQYNEALTHYKRQLAIELKWRDNDRLSVAYGNMGCAHARLDEFDTAMRFTRKSMECAKAAGNHVSQGSSFSTMGRMHLEHGRYDDAIDCARQSIRLLLPFATKENQTVVVYTCNAYVTLADAYAGQKKYILAIRTYEHVRSLNKKLECDTHGPAISLGLSVVYEQASRIEDAREHAIIGLAQAETTGDRALVGLAHCAVARTARTTEEAITECQKGLRICLELGDYYNEGQCYLQMVLSYVKANQPMKAQEYKMKYKELAMRIGGDNS
jgi:tetratricopeptide (TPR) repeat protein